MKTQKPIDKDIHLKYLCQKCGQVHWLSYKEASTKNYKVVCDCGNVFSVKRVVGFKLKYATKSKKTTTEIPTTDIDSDLLNKAVKLLVSYGFLKQEAEELIITTYNQNPINDFASLVKQALSTLKG